MQIPSQLSPESTVFVLVSFEGPDPYSQAGGLGVRMTGLAQALARQGHETHLFFVGDPSLPGEERLEDGRLILHRWCQWISAYAPGGVYDQEHAKRNDLTRSLPEYALHHVLLPAIAGGRLPVVLLEEWQTAEAACALSDALAARGVRNRAVFFWNANNPYGFQHVDWQRLAQATTITAVSRYMRAIIRAAGADALVIPNGISADLLTPVARGDVAAVRAALGGAAGGERTGMFFKMARWEREKGWAQAIEAVAAVRARGGRLMLIGRGGGPAGGAGGASLAEAAASRGLRAAVAQSEPELRARLGEFVREQTDVVSLGFGVAPALARSLYAAADGVLANSVSEPFGLVGLEAMAAGGIAYTGGTGEDYAITGRNAVVLETLDPAEIVARWDDLAASPDRALRLRREARKTAREYEWSRVLDRLLGTIRRAADPRLGLALDDVGESFAAAGAAPWRSRRLPLRASSPASAIEARA